MNRTSKSKKWFQDHINDPYVQAAKAAGYRSRASYKLVEMQEKYNIIKQRDSVCDLGSTPGGWSEQAVKWVGPKGTVIACDLIAMDPIPKVQFTQGDFTTIETQQNLKDSNNGKPYDVVLSDMAPDTIGHQATDQIRSIAIAEAVLEFCKTNLSLEGKCLIKVFQGIGFDDLIKNYRKTFKNIYVKKPQSSKSKSKEVYIYAIGLKP
jgi:23S rRNA (uridine2552-2'-O)-methyltransferase